MGLFGRTACGENRDWKVIAFLNSDANPIRLTEQLNEQEAKEFYDKLKIEILNCSNGWIECYKDNGDEYTSETRFLNLANITHIKLCDK